MFPEIDTPSVLVDLDVAEVNIDRFQAHCDAHGLAVRPHIKTHTHSDPKQIRVRAQEIGESALFKDAGAAADAISPTDSVLAVS